MSARIAARFRVFGVVQGVGFRASTRRHARNLGLDGVVNNRGDGSVEVLAAGAAEAVDRLREWLRHGPPSARVTQVEHEAIDAGQVCIGFFVR